MFSTFLKASSLMFRICSQVSLHFKNPACSLGIWHRISTAGSGCAKEIYWPAIWVNWSCGSHTCEVSLSWAMVPLLTQSSSHWPILQTFRHIECIIFISSSSILLSIWAVTPSFPQALSFSILMADSTSRRRLGGSSQHRWIPKKTSLRRWLYYYWQIGK